MKKAYCFSVLLMAFFSFSIHSQETAIVDSLHRELARYEGAKTDADAHAAAIILNELAIISLRADPKQAESYANRGLKLSKTARYAHGQFILNNTLAKIWESKEDYAQALKYYKASLNSARDEKPADKAAVYTSIGNMYGRLTDYPQALKNMLQGLELAKQSNDKFQIARVYNNIGVLNKFQKRHGEALKNFLRALEIMKVVGNKPAVGMMYHNIADTYFLQGRYDLSVANNLKAMEIARQIPDMRLQSIIYNGLGLAYSSQGHYDKAVQNFTQALQINQMGGFKEGVAKNYISLSRNYFLKGDLTNAYASAQKTLALAEEQNDEMQMIVYELFSKIHEQRKDFQKALEYERAFQKLQDSVYSRENDQAFSKLKIRYDFKNSQDSLRAIQVQKDIIAEAEIVSQRNTRNFIFLIMGIALLFLVILLWQRNKIAIVKRQKALETERNRISRDLHDNLGAQLSTVRMFVSSLKNNNRLSFAETVDNSIGMLDASIDELRGIMHEMHNPALIEKGYLNATEQLINRVNQLHAVRFDLSTHSMEDRPRQELEHQLYRVTQELINNTLKYANARNVSIDVLRRDRHIVLMYEDDGIGFNAATVSKGYGLNNIEIRVKSVGGKVDFDSMPGAGARTTIEIPE